MRGFPWAIVDLTHIRCGWVQRIVLHNACKVAEHRAGGRTRKLYVHRKGATRAFDPGHPDVPAPLRAADQPALMGGSMGTVYVPRRAPKNRRRVRSARPAMAQAARRAGIRPCIGDTDGRWSTSLPAAESSFAARR
ncbi:MAG TPA: RtcB family protein [Burkholderiaceae bacterium]|nr:RtcB family protein [Burkholderiaceae bacterium]